MQVDTTSMPTNKKTETTVSAPATITKGSGSTSNPADSITKAKVTKDPTVGNTVKRGNGQKLVAAPSRFKYIFEDEMLQHLMLLNA